MDKKQLALRNKNKEAQQRGDDFQAEMRRSWRLLPNLWRIRLKDGGGNSVAADELVIAEGVNILAEHKRTKKSSFQLDFLRPNQIQGLVDFDQVIKRNVGLVFVSFQQAFKYDECYAIRLVNALEYMKGTGKVSIDLDTLRDMAANEKCRWVVNVPRFPATAEPTFDLRGVLDCFKCL